MTSLCTQSLDRLDVSWSPPPRNFTEFERELTNGYNVHWCECVTIIQLTVPEATSVTASRRTYRTMNSQITGFEAGVKYNVSVKNNTSIVLRQLVEHFALLSSTRTNIHYYSAWSALYLWQVGQLPHQTLIWWGNQYLRPPPDF